jgi:hypothetical protein
MQLFKNESCVFDLALLGNVGEFVSGLSVDYEITKVSDGSLVTSGTMSEVANIYTFSYSFSTNGWYRLKYFTPIGYENGFESIQIVDNFLTKLSEIYELYGLDSAKPMTVSSNQRTAGTITQNITTVAGQVTVQRV